MQRWHEAAYPGAAGLSLHRRRAYGDGQPHDQLTLLEQGIAGVQHIESVHPDSLSWLGAVEGGIDPTVATVDALTYVTAPTS